MPFRPGSCRLSPDGTVRSRRAARGNPPEEQQEKGNGMEILSYGRADSGRWLKQIAESDWSAGRMLHQLLAEDRFGKDLEQ